MTRTRIAILIAFLIIVGVGISAIWWAGGGEEGVSLAEAVVCVNPASISAAPGDDITVSVEVTPGEMGISSGEIFLKFDPGILKVSFLEPGYFFGSTPLVGFKEVSDEDGILGYALARVGDTEVPSPDGVFTTITFHISDSAAKGESLLTLSYVSLADDNFQSVENIEVEHGSIQISQ